MEAIGRLSPEQRQQAIRSMVDGLAEKLKDNPQDRDGWLRLARARMVLGQADASAEAMAKADQLKPLDARGLADWAEALVRQIQPGAPPSKEAVAVLTRLEQAEPRNALALFYLGAADLAEGRKADAALEDTAGDAAGRCVDSSDVRSQDKGSRISDIYREVGTNRSSDAEQLLVDLNAPIGRVGALHPR